MTATRRNKNAGLSGFVSFMKRRDAEAALREFDGYDWGGSILRVGWSKAVPIAAKPMYGGYNDVPEFRVQYVTAVHAYSGEAYLTLKICVAVTPTRQR